MNTAAAAADARYLEHRIFVHPNRDGANVGQVAGTCKKAARESTIVAAQSREHRGIPLDATDNVAARQPHLTRQVDLPIPIVHLCSCVHSFIETASVDPHMLASSHARIVDQPIDIRLWSPFVRICSRPSALHRDPPHHKPPTNSETRDLLPLARDCLNDR